MDCPTDQAYDECSINFKKTGKQVRSIEGIAQNVLKHFDFNAWRIRIGLLDATNKS